MHYIEHAFFESIEMLPFIFLIYLAIEYFEHKNNTTLNHLLMKTGKLGAVVGALLGSVPQCGFSVIAADLFSKKSITAGTLIAIFIATSDEAIPIILSVPNKWKTAALIIVIKVIIGVLSGLVIDFVYKGYIGEEHTHHESCEACNTGIFKCALRHTIRIFIFILISSALLSIIIDTLGIDTIKIAMQRYTILQPFIVSLVGLIPNCAISVMLTECFLLGIIPFGSLIAGLCSSAGVGILLLLKRNRNMKENLSIILILYLIGAISGLIIQLIEAVA